MRRKFYSGRAPVPKTSKLDVKSSSKAEEIAEGGRKGLPDRSGNDVAKALRRGGVGYVRDPTTGADLVRCPCCILTGAEYTQPRQEVKSATKKPSEPAQNVLTMDFPPPGEAWC